MNQQQRDFLDQKLRENLKSERLTLDPDEFDRLFDELFNRATEAFRRNGNLEKATPNEKLELAATDTVEGYRDNFNDVQIDDLTSEVVQRKLSGQTYRSIADDLEIDIDTVKQIFRDGYINTEVAIQHFRDALGRFMYYEVDLFLLHLNGHRPAAIIQRYRDEVIELLQKYDESVTALVAQKKTLQGVQAQWHVLRQSLSVEEIYSNVVRIEKGKRDYADSLANHILTNRLGSMNQSMRNQLGKDYKDWRSSKKAEAKQHRDDEKRRKKEEQQDKRKKRDDIG